MKNIANGKIENNQKEPISYYIDHSKYYDENAADSKRTFSQVVDLDKYLKEINTPLESKNNFKNRSHTQNINQDDPFLTKALRSKTQNMQNLNNLDEKNYYKKYSEDRDGRENYFGNKKLERAKTKEPCLRGKNDESMEKYQKRKKDIQKILGDDDQFSNRKSRISLKNKQIHDPFGKKFGDEPKVRN